MNRTLGVSQLLLNTLCALVVGAFTASIAHAQQPVIPGAAGFGLETRAGRGGEIFRVTTLADSGNGSLRACVTSSGPRVCVFEVSGTIDLQAPLQIRNPYITIAGQTAPSPGILVRGDTFGIYASHVLVQHIAFRVGDSFSVGEADSKDTFQIQGYSSPVSDIVIDHCSFSWSVDELGELYFDFDDVTMSNNIFSEPLDDSVHSNGEHGFGVLIDNARGKVSLVGNLFAHARYRNPSSGVSDFVMANNVVYNAASRSVILYNDGGVNTNNSIVGNVFLDGPDTEATRAVFLNDGAFGTRFQNGSRLYLADNVASTATSDPWSIVVNAAGVSRSTVEVSQPPSWPNGLTVLSTQNDAVLDSVLANAGSRPAERDAVDQRIVGEVRSRSGQTINCVSPDGSQRCNANGDGWPQYAQNTRQLSLPANPNGDSDGDGYTNLEEFLHSMAADLEVPSDGGVGITFSAPMPPSSLIAE